MLIVAGHIVFDPADRDAYLASKHGAIKATRAESGNLAYALAADPVDPTRIIVFERWEDQESLTAHVKALKDAPKTDGPTPKGAEVKIFDISGERSLR